jgi:hypothetical protein
VIFAPTAATSIATAETDIPTGAIFGMTADDEDKFTIGRVSWWGSIPSLYPLLSFRGVEQSETTRNLLWLLVRSADRIRNPGQILLVAALNFERDTLWQFVRMKFANA